MKRKRQRTTARNAPLPNASRSDSPPGAGPARAAERLSGPIPDAGAPDLDLGHLLRGVAARGGAAKMLNSEIEHGPGPVAAALRLALSMVSGERRELEKTLARCDNNRAKAARVLGVSRRTLYNKLQKHGLI